METEFDSAEIIERGENGKEEAVLIRRTQGTPYSCNRRYDLDDLKDGHGFPQNGFLRYDRIRPSGRK